MLTVLWRIVAPPAAAGIIAHRHWSTSSAPLYVSAYAASKLASFC
jgi:hypothetical protein